ncbi:nucleoporin complex subunit 54-domain-containing protein [Polychytrium aggregatum]|uniref:nucleoporin complex subunit 54-domain-containing protein n=1 Tax=Polychytrium aggregatum TaxID=110093 RepID=UPI0022FE48DF|nr:nucleoporin complex subunit 54-domain-containing protein [Polychytrium aggregatum]KAI9199467.1 nucleoporin complex subunit 54-domain-containing protein [Polychytrium aggregatum]
MFGAPSSSGGFPFGSASAAQPAAPALGFGAAAAATPASSAPGAGFGFGGGAIAAPAVPSFGSFGLGASAAQTPATSSSLFGGLGASTAAPALGGFGSVPAAASAPLFGSAAPAAAPTSAFGGFGTVTTAPTAGGFPSAGGGLFGSSGTSFGGAAAPAVAPFGGASLFGAAQAAPSALIPQQQRPATIEDAIQDMMNAWDPSKPQCQFRHYFYNLVHPSEAARYTRPANHDEALWNQAQKDNPDPTCMVPVLAVGFGDIQKRIAEQENESNRHRQVLEDALRQLNKIQENHYLDITVRIADYKRKHRELAHRLLKIMSKIQIVTNKGQSIGAEEEALRTRLESINREFKPPSQLRGRVNEQWAQLQMLKESGRLASVAGSAMPGRPGEFEVVDEESLRKIYEALSETQKGLNILIQVVQADKKNAELMNKGYTDNSFSKMP